MEIKFLQDFQGVETGGVFYRLGQVVILENSVAARLVNDKRAELIEVIPPVPVEPVVEEPEVSEPVFVPYKKRGRK
jgi:hypothetical protein